MNKKRRLKMSLYDPLKIDTTIFPVAAVSDEKDREVRESINTELAADMLEVYRELMPYEEHVKKYGFNTDNWVAWFEFFIPHVAKYYGVDEEDVLNVWFDKNEQTARAKVEDEGIIDYLDKLKDCKSCKNQS